MAPKPIGVEASQEGDRQTLIDQLGGEHGAFQATRRLPQDQRYLVTRLYGFGFEPKEREEIADEMGLSATEFELLQLRALRNLRDGGRHGD